MNVGSLDYHLLYLNHNTTESFTLEYTYGNVERCRFTTPYELEVVSSDDGDNITLVRLDEYYNVIGYLQKV